MPWTHAVPLRSALRRHHRARPGRLPRAAAFMPATPTPLSGVPSFFFAPHPWSLIDGRLFWNPDFYDFLCFTVKSHPGIHSAFSTNGNVWAADGCTWAAASCTRAHCRRTSRLCSWPSRRQTNDQASRHRLRLAGALLRRSFVATYLGEQCHLCYVLCALDACGPRHRVGCAPCPHRCRDARAARLRRIGGS